MTVLLWRGSGTTLLSMPSFVERDLFHYLDYLHVAPEEFIHD